MRQALNLVKPWGAPSFWEAVCVAGMGWFVWLLPNSPQESQLGCTTSHERHLSRRGPAPSLRSRETEETQRRQGWGRVAPRGVTMRSCASSQ